MSKSSRLVKRLKKSIKNGDYKRYNKVKQEALRYDDANSMDGFIEEVNQPKPDLHAIAAIVYPLSSIETPETTEALLQILMHQYWDKNTTEIVGITAAALAERKVERSIQPLYQAVIDSGRNECFDALALFEYEDTKAYYYKMLPVYTHSIHEKALQRIVGQNDYSVIEDIARYLTADDIKSRYSETSEFLRRMDSIETFKRFIQGLNQAESAKMLAHLLDVFKDSKLDRLDEALVKMYGKQKNHVKEFILNLLQKRDSALILDVALRSIKQSEYLSDLAAKAIKVSSHPEKIEFLRNLTRNDSDRARKVAVELLAALRAPDAEDDIVRCLSDQSDTVVNAAIAAAALIRSAKAVPMLLKYVDGLRSKRSFLALEALGKIGDRTAYDEIASLCKEDISEKNRKKILSVLQQIDVSKANGLIDSIENEKRAAEKIHSQGILRALTGETKARNEALKELAEKNHKHVKSLLSIYTKQNETDRAERLLSSPYEALDNDVYSAIIDILNATQSLSVQEWTIKALRGCRDERIVPAIAAVYDRFDPYMQAAALVTLSFAACAKSVPLFLKVLSGDDVNDSFHRYIAMQSLSKINGYELYHALYTAMYNLQGDVRRLAAVFMAKHDSKWGKIKGSPADFCFMAEQRDSQALPLMEDAYQNGGLDVRENLVEGFAGWENERVLKMAIDLTDEEIEKYETYSSHDGLYGLTTLSTLSSERAKTKLLGLLDSPKSGVCSHVVFLFGRTKPKEAFEPMLRRLESLPLFTDNYPSNDLAIALMHTLCGYHKSEIVPILQSAVYSPAASVRTCAAECLQEFGDGKWMRFIKGDMEDFIRMAEAGYVGNLDWLKDRLRAHGFATRKDSATLLVRIAQAAANQQIISREIKTLIQTEHTDSTQYSHYDNGEPSRSSDCDNHEDKPSSTHTDNGIGIPLSF